MVTGSKFTVLIASLLSVTIGMVPCAESQELLTNGDFELGLVDVFPGWELEEFLSNGNLTPVNSLAIAGFANDPNDTAGGTGLWLRGFTGATEATSYDGSNGVASQVVPVTAGQSYTLTGNSNFEQNYSGGVDFLDGLSPLGELNSGSPVASPTQSFFEIEFLDNTGAVIGTPASLDLVNDDFQFSGGGWLAHTPLQATAPVGAVEARIVLKALDMAANINPGQSGFYDNFSFTDDSASETELLVNGTMNDFTQVVPNWEFEELPEGANTLALAGFANDTPGGANGLWIRGFVAGDGRVSQSVAATEGEEYVFKASSLFEANYTGGLPETGTETMLTLAFLDSGDQVIGTPISLDLREEQTNGGGWLEHTLMGVAPAGTAKAQVSGVVTGLVVGTGGGLSAFMDDFSLTLASAGLAGDFNSDGVVDAADYTVWRDNLGAGDESSLNGNGNGINGVDNDDYALWRSNFGDVASESVLASNAAPEPSAVLLACLASVAVTIRCRQRTSA